MSSLTGSGVLAAQFYSFAGLSLCIHLKFNFDKQFKVSTVLWGALGCYGSEFPNFARFCEALYLQIIWRRRGLARQRLISGERPMIRKREVQQILLIWKAIDRHFEVIAVSLRNISMPFETHPLHWRSIFIQIAPVQPLMNDMPLLRVTTAISVILVHHFSTPERVQRPSKFSDQDNERNFETR